MFCLKFYLRRSHPSPAARDSLGDQRGNMTTRSRDGDGRAHRETSHHRRAPAEMTLHLELLAYDECRQRALHAPCSWRFNHVAAWLPWSATFGTAVWLQRLIFSSYLVPPVTHITLFFYSFLLSSSALHAGLRVQRHLSASNVNYRTGTRSPSTEICFCTLWLCDLDLWPFDLILNG